MLPILCHSCSHRFQRTASALLAEDACPRCASSDLDVDEAGLSMEGSMAKVARKLSSITAMAMATNPGMTETEAGKIAAEVVQRYPKVVG